MDLLVLKRGELAGCLGRAAHLLVLGRVWTLSAGWWRTR